MANPAWVVLSLPYTTSIARHNNKMVEQKKQMHGNWQSKSITRERNYNLENECKSSSQKGRIGSQVLHTPDLSKPHGKGHGWWIRNFRKHIPSLSTQVKLLNHTSNGVVGEGLLGTVSQGPAPCLEHSGSSVDPCWVHVEFVIPDG